MVISLEKWSTQDIYKKNAFQLSGLVFTFHTMLFHH